MLNNISLRLCQPWRLKTMFRILEIRDFLTHKAIHVQVKWNWRIRLVPQNFFFFFSDPYFFNYFILYLHFAGCRSWLVQQPRNLSSTHCCTIPFWERSKSNFNYLFIDLLLHVISLLILFFDDYMFFLMCFSIWASNFLFIFKVQLYLVFFGKKDSLQWLSQF